MGPKVIPAQEDLTTYHCGILPGGKMWCHNPARACSLWSEDCIKINGLCCFVSTVFIVVCGILATLIVIVGISVSSAPLLVRMIQHIVGSVGIVERLAAAFGASLLFTFYLECDATTNQS